MKTIIFAFMEHSALFYLFCYFFFIENSIYFYSLFDYKKGGN